MTNFPSANGPTQTAMVTLAKDHPKVYAAFAELNVSDFRNVTPEEALKGLFKKYGVSPEDARKAIEKSGSTIASLTNLATANGSAVSFMEKLTHACVANEPLMKGKLGAVLKVLAGGYAIIAGSAQAATTNPSPQGQPSAVQQFIEGAQQMASYAVNNPGQALLAVASALDPTFFGVDTTVGAIKDARDPVVIKQNLDRSERVEKAILDRLFDPKNPQALVHITKNGKPIITREELENNPQALLRLQQELRGNPQAVGAMADLNKLEREEQNQAILKNELAKFGGTSVTASAQQAKPASREVELPVAAL